MYRLLLFLAFPARFAFPPAEKKRHKSHKKEVLTYLTLTHWATNHRPAVVDKNWLFLLLRYSVIGQQTSLSSSLLFLLLLSIHCGFLVCFLGFRRYTVFSLSRLCGQLHRSDTPVLARFLGAA
ncbi:hypothetical protein LX36DRAFT_34576 [Colletotrichum falcatum]|nr:hypothetical protein LX36DRAFT_34576 [Colletotrichum falcatum]